jgi:methionyl-tRNA formyltransferase
MKKPIVIFGCRYNTLDFIKSLNKSKFDIKLIISISPSVAKKNNVSGYCNLKKITEIKSKVIHSSKYNLQNDLIEFFKKKKYFLGFSIGWQRIIPDQILNSFRAGVLGMHCSYLPLPSGKGRSPIIWSIIKGHEKLYVQIFKYVKDFDEGPLVYREKIKILKYEDIDVIQKKLSLIFSSFANEYNFDAIKFLKKKKQNKLVYFPKRDQNSGKIYLSNYEARSFCDFVRAQAKPYPCAFISYKNFKFKIYEANIFMNDKKIQLNKNIKFHIFSDNTFIFRLKNEYVYVKRHNIKNKFMNNEIFNKIFI